MDVAEASNEGAILTKVDIVEGEEPIIIPNTPTSPAPTEGGDAQ